MHTELAALEVLRQYSSALSARLVFLGNRGGFSGARLWRAEAADWQGCLRAWPKGGMTAERLATIHQAMHSARAAGLDFVPAVYVLRSGQSFLEHAGRFWDLTAWLPGCADFQQNPSPSRLQAACVALVRLHNAWAKEISPEPCPAVMRRLDLARAWLNLIESGWQPQISPLDPVRPWAERAWHLLQGRVDKILQELAPWGTVALPVQLCLCDIWHDHVLFREEIVTGIVDYGSIKRDNVAVDLARLLGSLVADDAALRTLGLDAYQKVRPLSLEEQRLIPLLDETGVILGAANWLKWLYYERRSYEDREGVAGRLRTLVERMEKIAKAPGLAV